MTNLDNKAYYINRELSWIAFNERVLAQAADKQNPVLERLKFISIAASNLDEFFMIRVAGLKDQVKMGYNHPENKTQMTPAQQLHHISKRVHQLVNKLYSTLRSCLHVLQREGITFVHTRQMSIEQREFLADYYEEQIFPVLTSLAVDAYHPFPKLGSRRLNVAVLLKSKDDETTNTMFAVVQVPATLPRFIPLPSRKGKVCYAFLEEVISDHIGTLFEEMDVVETTCFRITRNSDIVLDEDVEDILEEIQKELKDRRTKGDAVRLEVEQSISESLMTTLRDWLDLTEDDVYCIHGPLDTTWYGKLYNVLNRDDLRYEKLIPQTPVDLMGEDNIYEAISQKDVMLFHPFESFDPVVQFIQQAADDPNVLAIKQTLYRVSGNSPIVAALARAAENGKQVTVLLEVKARFDEANNVAWSKKLEQSGCHVIYGLVGLKTHSKIALVVRKEGDVLRRYVHLGTGNYNEITAQFYTDIGMFTAREDFGHDATAFFNYLTGFTSLTELKQICTAPQDLKGKFLALIQNEIDKCTPENPGRIIAKMNSLTNKDIIKALYKASCHGVQIDLIVRGICCLRPGIVGVSENIRVWSIVGQLLEHSRIFYFQNGGDELFFLSSADWMTRNLEHRVELLFPVLQENLKARLKHILNIQLLDNVNRYSLTRNSTYKKVALQNNLTPVQSQLYFYEEAVRHVVSYDMERKHFPTPSE